MWGYKNKSYLDQTKVINGLGTLIVGKDGRNVIQTYYQPSNSYYQKYAINADSVEEFDLIFGTRNVTIVNNNNINLYVAKTDNDMDDDKYMIVPAYSSYRVTFPIKNKIWVYNQDIDDQTFYLEMEV